MGRMKEFFHEEICRMQDGEDLHIDDAYMYAKWQAAENANVEAQIAEHESMQLAIAESGVPSFLFC
jgi:hypothetical protein